MNLLQRKYLRENMTFKLLRLNNSSCCLFPSENHLRWSPLSHKIISPMPASMLVFTDWSLREAYGSDQIRWGSKNSPGVQHCGFNQVMNMFLEIFPWRTGEQMKHTIGKIDSTAIWRRSLAPKCLAVQKFKLWVSLFCKYKKACFQLPPQLNPDHSDFLELKT